jgi:hypothetical protein
MELVTLPKPACRCGVRDRRGQWHFARRTARLQNATIEPPRTTESNMSKQEFMARVQTAREHWLAMCVPVIVISQRGSLGARGRAFQIYRCASRTRLLHVLFRRGWFIDRLVALVKLHRRKATPLLSRARPRGRSDRDRRWSEDPGRRSANTSCLSTSPQRLGRVRDRVDQHRI